MTDPSDDAARNASREHETELLDELNALLQAAVPPGATVREAELAMVAAMLSDPTIMRLVDRVRALASHGRGLLHERLEDPDRPHSALLTELDELGDDPVEIDIEDAFSAFVDTAGEQMEISFVNAAGEETASASGLLVKLEGVEEGDKRFAEFTFSPDDGSQIIRIPGDPVTRCVIAPDGSITGTLPDGSGWSVVYPGADSPGLEVA